MPATKNSSEPGAHPIPAHAGTNQQLRADVLSAARALFQEKGYEAVGMREIARAVGRQPTQLYRLDISKADILADIIIELNAEQIEALPLLLSAVRGRNALERTCGYLIGLYASDIAYLPLRSIGAAHGWAWSARHEEAVLAQVWKLLEPVIGWLRDDGYEDLQARCYGVWSLYYVGYRGAVMRGHSATECLDEIRPSLALLFQRG